MGGRGEGRGKGEGLKVPQKNPRKEFAVASCAEIKTPIIEKKDFVLLQNNSKDFFI
jgi:hypothetical protein